MNKLYENRVVMVLLALFLSILLFVFVKAESYKGHPVTLFQNVSESTTESLNNVPVHVKGNVENYYITGLPDTVNVQLSGPSNLIRQTLENEQLRVVTEDLTDLGEGQHYIRLSIPDLNENIHASIQPSSVNITISTLETTTYPVTANINKNELKEGFAIGNTQVKPERVSLSGSKSALEQVAHVSVNIKIPPSAQEAYSTQATVIITNSQGEVLDVKADPAKVTVTTQIVREEKNVPVRLKAINPNDDYNYQLELLSDNQVTISASLDRLAEITSLPVEVDVSNLTKTSLKTLSLPVPDGVRSITPTSVRLRIIPSKKSESSTGSSVSHSTSESKTSN